MSVAVFGSVLLGGMISLAIGMHYFWFVNLWIGAVAGILPGYVAGAAWQVASGRVPRSWSYVRCVGGAVGIMTIGFVFGLVLPCMRGEMRRLKVVAGMQSEAIQRIDVYDEDRKQMIVSLTEPKALKTFAQGIADVAGFVPNPPQYSHSWFVVVHGDSRYEFVLHISPELPQHVVGTDVSKSESWTDIRRRFWSEGLRPWVEEHLVNSE